ncbi:MAG: XRE family transcriptional regulator [Myxococcota bacterium]|nr:XRE family transcriptional regulator [Myxococcota bacterium]
MAAGLPENLAADVKRLREGSGLSQQQMATLSGIPRPTWASLESGSANPTLSVLSRAAAALQVSIEELIGAPRSSCQLFPAGSVSSKRRGSALMRPLLPEAIPGLQIGRLQLPPGGAMTGVPHTEGTREYLTCESGTVELSTAGEVWSLSPGDTLVFRGDQKHGYRNPGRSTAVAISVVAFAPP